MSIIEDPHDGGLWFSTQRGLLYIKDNHHKIFSLFDGKEIFSINEEEKGNNSSPV